MDSICATYEYIHDIGDEPQRGHDIECIGKTNPDRSVLITIITWHFQFHPVNVSNLLVKGTYVLETRAVSPAPPIVTWYPLTTGIVASQYPSTRDAVLQILSQGPPYNTGGSYIRYFMVNRLVYI